MYGIADTGATIHCGNNLTPAINKRTAVDPMDVSIPNGTIMSSTHSATLPFSQLPQTATDMHIYPNLPTPLLSIGKFCDAGYKAIFDAKSVTIQKDLQTILSGTRNYQGLWTIPIPRPLAQANFTVYDATTKQIIKFLHRSLWSPTKSTVLKALANNHFVGWPAFTTDNVKRHLRLDEHTIMGHMDRQRKNIRSTKTDTAPAEQDVTVPPGPQIVDGQHTHDVVFAVTDPPSGKIFTDQTGTFPIVSNRGVKAVMVLYDYDSNAIITEGITSRGQVELLRAYTKLINKLKQAGLKPKLQRLDNEASAAMKSFMTSQTIDYQLTQAGLHRRNAAERAIRTWKNHFLAGLSSVNPRFPLRLWCQLLPQAELTLNLLRQSRVNPKLSAYAQLHGQFDFNRTPLAPPGCESIIFNGPDQRASWDFHGEKAWYTEPAMEHYRCYKTVNPLTNRQRIADTIEFLPHDFEMPKLSSADLAAHAAADLTNALRNPHPAAPFLPPTAALSQELKQLADIFDQAAKPKPKPADHNQPRHPATQEKTAPGPNIITPTKAPRVSNNTAMAAVAPRVLATETTAQAPRVHTQAKRMATKAPPMAPLIPTANVSDVTVPIQATPLDLANGVFDHDSGKTLEYRQLIKHPAYKERWLHSAANEFGRLAQGVGDRIKGTDTIKFIRKEDVPAGRTVTYGRFVCDLRPQKAEVERTRVTVGGDRIEYPGKVSSPTAGLTTMKLHVNDTLSTPNAKNVMWDIHNFYLNTPLDRHEYMKIHIDLIPQEIIDQYHLESLKDDHGFVFIRIEKGMYGLPQAGILANQLLQHRLAPHGYAPVQHTPGLWKHRDTATSFVLVVDDFSVKYVKKKDATDLLAILRQWYEIKVDWDAALFCGITFEWNYHRRTCRLSMPGYIMTMLGELNHPPPKRPQFAPYPALPILYGRKGPQYVHRPGDEDDDPPRYLPLPDSPTEPADLTPLGAQEAKRIPQIVGKLLYYARAVDPTLNVSLSSLASEQANPTRDTNKKVNQLLDYCHTNPDAGITYHASDMFLHLHSDAGYNSEAGARSRSGGHLFLTNYADKPALNNGAILNPTHIIKHVASSAADAEIGATFINCKETIPLRTTLHEMGWPQPPTPVILDNTTAVGFANDTIKKKQTKALDMRYHWLLDREAQNQFMFIWKQASENMGDYMTKHFGPAHHQHIRPQIVS
jgi:hypothetical protein